jgi:hypothetical protein
MGGTPEPPTPRLLPTTKELAGHREGLTSNVSNLHPLPKLHVLGRTLMASFSVSNPLPKYSDYAPRSKYFSYDLINGSAQPLEGIRIVNLGK